MTAYYNEIDPYAAQWLRNLIAAGHIAAGDVDERDIREVHADDLRGYAQHHFFAGIAGWSLALRLAGWDDARPVWTGSCPCQPFSAAGKGEGGADDRHLWPHWFRLVRECRPATVFGEQVAAAIGWGWLDAVFADLEGEGYATGAAVLGACSVGAPHIRQRLWFVAKSDGGKQSQERAGDGAQCEQRPQDWWRAIEFAGVGAAGRDGELADATSMRGSQVGLDQFIGSGTQGDCASRNGQHAGGHRAFDCASGRCWSPIACRAFGYCRELGHADGPRPQGRGLDAGEHAGQLSPWAAGELVWLPCTDGKARPAKPGIQPLANGVSGRVGRLRAYGNAIIPQAAAAFVRATG